MKTRPTATISTTISTWTDMGLSPVLRSEKSARSCVSHCTVF